MLDFKPVSQGDLATLRRYYADCDYQLCEYSALVKYMWRCNLNSDWTEAAGCLIIRNDIGGKICFDYPIPGPQGDEDAALEHIEEWCLETGTPLEISVVPVAKAPRLLVRYPRFKLINNRSWWDYVYDAEALRTFAGRHYSGQRNHINKFRKLYPQAEWKVLGEDDGALIERFWDELDEAGAKQDEKAVKELRLSKEMLELRTLPFFFAGGFVLEGRLISIAMGEICGDTLHEHIEKALPDFEGVYPATVQAFAQAFATDGVRYINRQDDVDDKGLRTSKLQYRPVTLAQKYCFSVLNELDGIDAIPTLETDRLTLSALEEGDKPAYNALCLDDERNLFWGYDFREDWKGEPLKDYFLDVARRDFATKMAINFAVRLEGEFIGEVVLYRFDGKGHAELGCRIAPAYDGHGYGVEAFQRVAEWALYSLGLRRVVAKCHRPNEASYRMLSSCMRRVGEDETFYYFAKEV
ncbi:MAG: GNAT family N-acetyltransferase [Coriobacteriales bacterium]|nr:GNAT family N-acetyltransferase [Coriobacteriales bacterium]MBQ6586542.1 GNAT family N-acetyltransferase [Coriobacteriales bacterium]